MQRMKTIFDVVVSITMVSAAAILVRDHRTTTNATRPSSVQMAVPTQALSIDGLFIRGSAQASSVMVEFTDFQCSFCGEFQRDVFPAIEREYVTTGRLAVVVRHLPLKAHPFARVAAEAVECAAMSDQYQFAAMFDAMFTQGASLDEPGVRSIASSFGIDQKQFEDCLSQRQAKDRVDSDIAAGAHAGCEGDASVPMARFLPPG